MNYLKSVTWILGPFIVLSFFFSLFYYLNWMNPTIYQYLKLLLPIFCFFLGGWYLGKHSKQMGWLEGLKLGGSIVILLFMISYLAFDIGFSLKGFIYYLIILFTSMFGSMVGIRNVENSKNTR